MLILSLESCLFVIHTFPEMRTIADLWIRSYDNSCLTSIIFSCCLSHELVCTDLRFHLYSIHNTLIRKRNRLTEPSHLIQWFIQQFMAVALHIYKIHNIKWACTFTASVLYTYVCVLRSRIYACPLVVKLLYIKLTSDEMCEAHWQYCPWILSLIYTMYKEI